ncbi:hypothetical protein O3G_MSEX006202 [Manduca sexta]|uniref:Peptidase S1 domain-containing protein n=1 Tax=Manduca sexta TaxID=7130 RepID=A0A922CKZ0_MANSE|nr:hypothetical protein O3G_MSEX006202 [Manduca sexta]KAG6449752.1 hypothetical protein O3G_MSEX006202 [Manduca sexta]
MKRTCVSVVILGLFILFADSQYAQSPCPSVFEYQADGPEVFGVVRLKSNGPVSSVHLRINFTVATHLFSSYVGRIEPIGNERALLNFNRGEPLTYRVHFPVMSPLPRLTHLIVNGNVLCYGSGDIPGPNQYVTTISLEHMLFLKSGGSTGFNNFNYPTKIPEAMVHFVGEFGNNAQLYTINDIDNNSWNTNYYSHDVPNSTRPTPTYVQQTPPPAHEPDYNYYYQEPTTQIPLQRPRQPPPAPPPPPQVISTPTRTQEISPTTPVQCGVIAGGNERVPLIFNGQSYSRGDWPWLVALYRRKEGSLTFICSGTLVSDRHVVTAAHCMQQKSKISTIKDIVVKVGVYNLEDWGDDISVTRTLTSANIHESYNAATLENDILVVTFEKKVEFNTYIRPACLWNGNTDLTRIVGASGVVAGWGTSELGPSGQGEPRMVRIPVVSTAQCRASKPEFHKLTSAKTLCAGDRKGSGPCTGDSGGGLYILDGGRWRIRGVVSLSLRPQNGDNTCNLNEYIVFTDTAQYLPWMRNIMSKNLYD